MDQRSRRRSVGFERATSFSSNISGGGTSSSFGGGHSPPAHSPSKKDGITEHQMRYLDDLLLTKQKSEMNYRISAKQAAIQNAASPEAAASPTASLRRDGSPNLSPRSPRTPKVVTQERDLASFYLGSKATPDQLARMQALGRSKHISPKRIAASANRLSDVSQRNNRLAELEEKVSRDKELECTHKPELSRFVYKQRRSEAKELALQKRREQERLDRERDTILQGQEARMNQSFAAGALYDPTGNDQVEGEGDFKGPTTRPPEGNLYRAPEDVPHYMMPPMPKIQPQVDVAPLHLTDMAQGKKRNLADLFAWEEDRVDRYRLADGNGRALLGKHGKLLPGTSNCNMGTDVCSTRAGGQGMQTSVGKSPYKRASSATNTKKKGAASSMVLPLQRSHCSVSLEKDLSIARLAGSSHLRAQSPSAPPARGYAKSFEQGKRRAVTPTVRSKAPQSPATGGIDLRRSRRATNNLQRSGSPDYESALAGTAGSLSSTNGDRPWSGFHMTTPRKSQPVFHEDLGVEDPVRPTSPGSRQRQQEERDIVLDEVVRPEVKALSRHAEDAFRAARQGQRPRSTFVPHLSVTTKMLGRSERTTTDVLEDAINVGIVKGKEALEQRQVRKQKSSLDMKVADALRREELAAAELDSDGSETEIVWEDNRYIQRKKEKKKKIHKKEKHEADKCAVDSKWWFDLIKSDKGYRKNRVDFSTHRLATL